KQVADLTAKLRWYEERLRIAQHRRFGSSSERTASEQEPLPLLFDEAELISDPKVEEPTTETITYTRRKAKGKRDQDLEDLPVERIEYRLPEEERTCAECHGELHEMSAQLPSARNPFRTGVGAGFAMWKGFPSGVLKNQLQTSNRVRKVE